MAAVLDDAGGPVRLCATCGLFRRQGGPVDAGSTGWCVRDPASRFSGETVGRGVRVATWPLVLPRYSCNGWVARP